MSDVPCFLVPLTELARLAGIATPVLDAMITVAGGLAARDFRAEGRSLEALDLAGMSLAEVRSQSG
jgi:opine dehydrogenase